MRYLLHYCTEHLDSGPEDVRELLHEVMLMIGYFVTLAPASQDLIAEVDLHHPAYMRPPVRILL
jgi:hypothetical protein